MYPINITDTNAFDVLCEKIRESYPLTDVNDNTALLAVATYRKFVKLTSTIDPKLMDDLNSVIGTIAKFAYDNAEGTNKNLMWSAKCHAVILFALRDWVNTFLELMGEKGGSWLEEDVE